MSSLSSLPEPARDLPAPGPASSDAELAAWRTAAATGQLPAPTRERWQVLRAGIVNLWEFDTAEYWFADGRAQFVGQNQSGKSTLMALTTLIMLAGDLDRQYVDTFGERHKSFRYYVEPTDDATDRRSTDGSLNRGWAWVEYGRQNAGTPEFFTTLLYTQARRGAKDYVKQWSTCHGTSRVGRELLLVAGSQSKQPGEVSSVAGFKIADNGTEYRQRIATNLFGFDDTDRLDAVVRMLKVLRTPNLGRKLDPAFFTTQMREALPAIAKSEIDELAEGWDQLDRLANDRDSAEAAQQAVQAFLRKAWNPWADSVLRRQADELVATVTRFDDVTKNIRRATDIKKAATSKQAELEKKTSKTSDDLHRTGQNFDNLRDSQAYQDAHQATTRVEQLKQTALDKRSDAEHAAHRADKARERAASSQQALAKAETELARHLTAKTAAAAAVTHGAQAAGLPDETSQWLDRDDTGRLLAAVQHRRAQVALARKLLTALAATEAAQETSARLNAEAQADLARRQQQLTDAEAGRDDALQQLSDQLETWAAHLPDGSDSDLRDRWMEAVLEQVGAERPRAVLTALIRSDWLEPRRTVLRDEVSSHERLAAADSTRAGELEADAQRLLDEPDPQPDGPLRWSRRNRPASSPDGGPLWLLLDPVDELPETDLAGVEAALDAAGLLDAWVSPEGVYLAERDGHDVVVDLTVHGATYGEAVTLARVLRPAQTAGPLTATVTALLHAVGYAPAGSALPTSAMVALSSDGRWATPVTAGTAGTAEHGAELLGTAARTVARNRRVAELRAEAAELLAEADARRAAATELKSRISDLEAQAGKAPHDDQVVAAAHSYRHARTESTTAERRSERRIEELRDAETASTHARSSLLEHTGATNLPRTDAGLTDVSTALEAAKDTIRDLSQTLSDVRSGTQMRDREAATALSDEQEATDLQGQSQAATRVADNAQDAADNAEEALGQDEREILAALEQLKADKEQLTVRLKKLTADLIAQASEVATATEKLASAESDRELAEQQRAVALGAWWRPVDAGLAAYRGLPDAPASSERRLTHAVEQSRAARELLNPTNWPTGPGDTLEAKGQRVNAAFTKMTGPALIELRTVLESSGGRSASVLDADETGLLPAIVVLVDSSGAQVDPVEAVTRLTEQADNLTRMHDEKMQSVLVELLSSTFVEHLRERLGDVVKLINNVNSVLSAHPTGANDTRLRLKRVAADGQKDAFGVLDALEKRFIDDIDVQDQVRTFLEKQIREAQDLGRGGDTEWQEHLADLLDYRKWFDVVTEFQVLGSAKWTALTAEVHAKDSGGGKVVTLLQPLLATLVALYDESGTAPRPLWLDEAFTGVDDTNRSTMLDLLVEFDLDFLMAGPAALVACAQVPSAAAWFVTRAPAPDAGVDLSLMLWAGRTMSLVALPAKGLGSAAAKHPVVIDDDRPSLFDVAGP